MRLEGGRETKNFPSLLMLTVPWGEPSTPRRATRGSTEESEGVRIPLAKACGFRRREQARQGGRLRIGWLESFSEFWGLGAVPECLDLLWGD